MSLSLILPLNIAGMGYESFQDSATQAAVQQNLRMLLLTAPGEYVMDGNFGVGLRNYLFDPGLPSITNTIERSIYNQCSTYMPYIEIGEILINTENIDSNVISIKIVYTISESVLNEVLELTVSI